MKLGWKATGSGVMCEGSPYTNYSKIKRVEMLESCIATAVEGNWRSEK